MNFRSLFLSFGLLLQCASANPTKTSTTTPSPTPTSINPAGPYVPSCNGPQRYVIGVHAASNNSYIGHLRAQVIDGDQFLILASPNDPDGNQYVHEWLVSAAPQDNGDFYLYVPQGAFFDNDTYYLGARSQNGIDKDGEEYLDTLSRAEWPNGFEQFACSIAKKTNLVSCSVPGTHGSYQFVVRLFVSDGVQFNYAYYRVTGKGVSGDVVVYMKVEKSC